MQTIQRYDINSQDRPVDATDHQRNCLVAATATATGSIMTVGPGHSFVGGLQPLCGGEAGKRVRSSDACNAVCIRATGTCCVMSIGSQNGCRRGVAVECRTRDQEVAGSSLGWALRRKNSGQVSHTYVPLSPSCITLCWPAGGDA